MPALGKELPGGSIGARIHHLRQYRGLTQQQLASLVDVAPSTISLWERNRRRPMRSRLADVAAALHTTLTDLIAKHEASAIAVADDVLLEFSQNDRLLLTDRDYEVIHNFVNRRITKRRAEAEFSSGQVARVGRGASRSRNGKHHG
jgi:transcriptional regulator with XRE-family HTH domain